MFCINCGAQVPDGSRFCPNCGYPTGVAPTSQPGPSVVGGAARSAESAASRVVDAINGMAGGSDHVELKFGNFFDAVLKKHEKGEADELFVCGTPSTTPSLAHVRREWPHPWVYSRVFLVLLVALVGLYVLSAIFQNPNGYPGLMFVGALLAPFTVLVFFFETNISRNVSFARVIEIFFIGGVFSLLCIYPLGAVLPGGGVGDLVPAMITGIVEEIAKAILVAFFLYRFNGRDYVLTGLLVGAGVGAGFGVFETAGYIFNYGFLSTGTVSGMVDILMTRSFIAMGMHVSWAAIEGGALALCDDGGGFKPEHLWSGTFLQFLAISVVLHGIWDMYVPFLDDIAIPLVSTPKYALLIVAVWVVLFVLLHRGVAQINELANAASRQGAGAEAPRA